MRDKKPFARLTFKAIAYRRFAGFQSMCSLIAMNTLKLKRIGSAILLYWPHTTMK